MKAHLATKFHDEYDGAVAAFQQRMAKGAGAVPTRRGSPTASATRRRAPFRLRNMTRARPLRRRRAPRRHGHRRRAAGGDLQRGERVPLHPRPRGRAVARRPSRSTRRCASSARADPTRLIVSYQIPIHDIDAAVAEVRARRRARRASRCSSRCSRPRSASPDYYHERYDPLFALIQETGLPICCHIGLNTDARRPRRSATPRRAARSWCRWRAQHRRGARHVDHGRRVRAVPRPQGRVRRARPRVDRVVAVHRRRHGHAPGLRAPRRSPSCRASTSTATCSSRSSTRPTRITAPSCATGSASRTSCGRATTRTR